MRSALQRWLGDLMEVSSLEVVSEDASLRVDLSYVVRRTAEIRSVTFTRGGGA